MNRYRFSSAIVVAAAAADGKPSPSLRLGKCKRLGDGAKRTTKQASQQQRKLHRCMQDELPRGRRINEHDSGDSCQLAFSDLREYLLHGR